MKALVLAAAAASFVCGSSAHAVAVRAGFDTDTLPANDDGSTGLVDIGFAFDFFGEVYTQLWVNNNGNVTFDAPLAEFTPFPLIDTTTVILAPFFADVDTRTGMRSRTAKAQWTVLTPLA